jgi:hypothetical protein
MGEAIAHKTLHLDFQMRSGQESGYITFPNLRFFLLQLTKEVQGVTKEVRMFYIIPRNTLQKRKINFERNYNYMYCTVYYSYILINCDILYSNAVLAGLNACEDCINFCGYFVFSFYILVKK